MRTAIYLGLLVIAEQVQHIAESHGYKPKESNKSTEVLAALFFIFAVMDLIELFQ